MSSQSSIQRPSPVPFPTFEEILNTLPAAIYLCDADGYITAFNEHAVRLWGERPILGKDLWHVSWKYFDLDNTPIKPDEAPMAITLKTGKPVTGREMIVEQRGGARFNVLPHPHPLFDDTGLLRGAINMVIDVTAQSRYNDLRERTRELSSTMEALKRSEEQYHRMVAEVEDYAIILLSKDGRIENWNKGAEKIKGYNEDEILGKSFKTFYSPSDQANGLPDRLLAEAAVNGKVNHEGWRVRKDGGMFWGSVSITALHDDQGNVIGFSKVTRDLTEHRKQKLQIEQMNEDLRLKNELLRRSEERYQRMVSEVEDYVIILLTPDGLIENWNKGAQKIKGYTSDEIIGKHFSTFYPEEDRRRGIPAALLKEAELHGKALHEGWRQRKDGSRFWGSVVITALHNSEGALIGFTKVTRDLTEKKIAEEKLLQSSITLKQKNFELERINEELSSFAYISSHDLQEPLRKIQTFSDRIHDLEFNNLSDRGKDYFKRMQAGAARMQKLIQDILAYSRTTTSEKILEVTDLNEILASSRNEMEVLITEKRAIITSDHLPTIKVIPFQIHQLFSNLLNNALKFSKPDNPPRIRIQTTWVKGKDLQHLHPLPADTYCHLSFSDNGIGFEPEYNKKIFEVFQRLHGRSEYGGTGIGLAICKKIVENHNGLIYAEGQLNEGATFHLYLPNVD